MTLRERLEWIFRMALLVFILASVAFLSALTAMRFAIQGREVSVPDVVGKNAVEAQQMLQGRGLVIKVEDRLYNPLPVDVVVRQTPPPGMKVKIGQEAHVVISLGPQQATIPALTDRSVRAARIAAQHGAKVMLAEEYRVGGTCVIRGCVPKKLLVYASRFRADFEEAAGYGWTVPQWSFDWPTLIANKDKEIARLKLESMGHKLDKLTPEQEHYLASWQEGT